jgi:hypothetical protein
LLCEQILQYAENNGYPFAKIQLKDIQLSDSTINGYLKFDKNQKVTIDSIDIISDDLTISSTFIQQYLAIQKGDLYSEKKLKQISTKLRQLSFLQEQKPWRMSFSLSQNILTLFLKSKNANRADFLVGLAPSNSTVGNRFFLTGDIKLGLVNSLHYGEQLNLNWQNLQYKSPRLSIDYTLPYILNTGIGNTAKFNYIKNDSSFATTATEFGFTYPLPSGTILKLYYTGSSSRIITVDTLSIKSRKALPANVDFSIRGLGITAQLNTSDYLLNPRKGVVFSLNGLVGIKKIIRNSTIENLKDVNNANFSYLYDSIKTATYKYQLLAQLAYYKTIYKNLIMGIIYKGGAMYNPNLFKNELFQIGGYRSLRGFDEASLFTNNYQILSLEPKFIINRTSYVFLLSDIGQVSLPLAQPKSTKIVFGFGGGLSLETKSGMFNVIYAFGNNGANGIQFKNSKIHFGYINVF